MSDSLLLTFATELEARKTLQALDAARISHELWRFAKGDILVTGMGIVQTSICLSRHLERSNRYSALWNLGFAASLKKEAIGSIRPVKHLHRLNPWHTCDLTSQKFFLSCFPPQVLTGSAQGAVLVTVDAPLHQTDLSAKLSRSADLLDMEGYAAIAVANSFALPAHCVKIVSDFGENGGREQLRANASAVSLTLARWVFAQLL